MRRRVVAAVAVALIGAACSGGGDKPGGKPGAEKATTTTSAPSATTGTGTGTGSALRALLPAEVRSSGRLRVGSDIEYPPIEFFVPGTTQVEGLDYDLGSAVAAALGLRVDFINDTDFAGVVSALGVGRFDVIMSAMNDTAERRGHGVDFIDYLRAGSSILVAKGNPEKIAGIDDLCGRTVAVQQGTVQDTDVLAAKAAACHAAGRDMKVLRLERDADALTQVRDGRAVADVEDFPVAAYNARTSGGGRDFDVVGGQVGAVGSYGIAVPATQRGLRDALVGALRAVEADGTYGRILSRWGVSAGALPGAPVNGGS